MGRIDTRVEVGDHDAFAVVPETPHRVSVDLGEVRLGRRRRRSGLDDVDLIGGDAFDVGSGGEFVDDAGHGGHDDGIGDPQRRVRAHRSGRQPIVEHAPDPYLRSPCGVAESPHHGALTLAAGTLLSGCERGPFTEVHHDGDRFVRTGGCHQRLDRS